MPKSSKIVPIQEEMPAPLKRRHRKAKIPKALREAIWLKHYGRSFEGKCQTTWCSNTINAWDFQAGHNIPESKGGPTTLENLIPLCGRCNLSMSNTYTFQEWCALDPQAAKPRGLSRWFCCFSTPPASPQPSSLVGSSNPAKH
jgi:hypothetical protein